MQVESTYKDIWKIALPVIFGGLAMTIINITDTAFLGRVGETELGASAVGGILYFAFAMIGASIGTGAQIMIARRAGEKKDKEVGSIFDTGFIILLLISLVLFILLQYAAPPLLKLILRSPELTDAADRFLHYRSYGIFAIMIAAVFRSFYVGIAQPKVYGVYSFIMAGVNIYIGYVLIFGNHGFPKMGIEGAGIASSIAEFLGLVFLIFYTALKKDIKQYGLFRFKSISNELTAKIINLSVPLVVQNLLSMGSWFLFFVFIEKIGSHELAISNIVRGVYMISMTPIWGFSVAANSMISNIIGQKKTEEVPALLNKIIRLTLIIALVMIAINVIFPHQLLHLFTDDIKLVNDSLSTLHVVDIAMIFFSFAIVAISAVSGTGATSIALYIEIIAILLYMVYNWIITFVIKGPVEVLWLTEIIYWLFTGIASYYYIRSMKWKKIVI